MLKDAMKYFLNVTETKIHKINELNYSDKPLSLIQDPDPNPVCLSTLSGLVNYITEKVDYDKQLGKLIIHIESPTCINVLSELREDKLREAYIKVVPVLPRIHFDNFIDIERFNIMLQSCFVKSNDLDLEDINDLEKVLSIIGNIKEETVRETGDDGISQEVVVREGVSRVKNADVPNPVFLKPYRTFVEIEQPVSSFVLRMKDGPSAALFEADGGAWRIDAVKSINEYLTKALETFDNVIIID